MLHHRKVQACLVALVAASAAMAAHSVVAVPFTTSYIDGANWNAIYAQGFSPSETPNPDPALATDAVVPLDRFQFFKSGNAAAPTNVRLAIVSNYFLNLTSFTTSSPELMHGPVGQEVVGLSTNTIASTAAIPTGGSITFNFNSLPLVYGNDYAAIYVTEGQGGVLTPVLVASLIADYVEEPPGSGMFRPESDYGDVEIDYFKATSNFINTNEFGSFLATFGPLYADANFIASFDLPPPDYNHDGAWNDADFTEWKNEFGQMGAGLDADGDLDGDVDGADFLFWQQRNGGPASVASAAPIPEPATAILAGLAALTALSRRRGA